MSSTPDSRHSVGGRSAGSSTNTKVPGASRLSTAGSGVGRLAAGSSPPCGSPVYLEMAYIPNGYSAQTVNVDFFKLVRSSCYVISGEDTLKEKTMRPILDSLLEGKALWGNDVQVTLIPTFDSQVMHDWYQDTHERQQDLGITVLGSNSTVAMQDETFPACKVEF